MKPTHEKKEETCIQDGDQGRGAYQFNTRGQVGKQGKKNPTYANESMRRHRRKEDGFWRQAQLRTWEKTMERKGVRRDGNNDCT